VHGTKAFPQAVVDWRPFDEYTVVNPGDFPGTSVLATTLLEDAGDATTVTLLFGPPVGPPLWRTLENLAFRVFAARVMRASTNALVEAVTERVAREGSAVRQPADA
jgi:hypothetical protein